MEKGQENENLTEMVTFFKNRLITEQCFDKKFASQKIEGKGMLPIKNDSETTIAFIRDPEDEEEFYLEVSSKEINPKTKQRDSYRIPVDDVDEIEHVDGTLNFHIHYQSASTTKKGKIKGFIKRKLTKNSDTKKDRSDLFESKFVK